MTIALLALLIYFKFTFLHAQQCQTTFSGLGNIIGTCGPQAMCQGRKTCCQTSQDCTINCGENGCNDGTILDCQNVANCYINCHYNNSCTGVRIEAQNAGTLTVSTSASTDLSNPNALDQARIYCPDNGISGGSKTCTIDCGACDDQYECADIVVYAREGFNDLLLKSTDNTCFEKHFGLDVKCGLSFGYSCKADWVSPNWECRSPDEYCDKFLLPEPTTSPTNIPSISPTYTTTNPSVTPTSTPITFAPTTYTPTTNSPTTFAPTTYTPTTHNPTTTVPTTYTPTTYTPTTFAPTTTVPTTYTPTYSPITLSPTPEQCIVFKIDSMNSTTGWKKISGNDVVIALGQGHPQCVDKSCWQTKKFSYYRRAFYTEGYQNIWLSFNYYSTQFNVISPYEYCRIKYEKITTKIITIFEDNGHQREYKFGWNTIKLPPELDDTKFNIYIESTADIDDESCFFDNIQLCGFEMDTNSPTYVPTLSPTNIPTKLPAKQPTFIPSISPTYIPTTGAEGEHSGKTTEFDNTSDKFIAAQNTKSDMVIIIAIIAALIAFIVIVIGLICCYRIWSNNKNVKNKNKIEMMKVSSISNITHANSDDDIMDGIDIMAVNGTQNTNMKTKSNVGEGDDNTDEGNGTDNELLYEGNGINNQINENEYVTPQTPGDNIVTVNDEDEIYNDGLDDLNEHNENNKIYEKGNHSNNGSDDEMYLKGNNTKREDDLDVDVDVGDNPMYEKGNKTQK